MIEKIANTIEEIFDSKQLGHFSPEHTREQLLKQLMYLTQAQREAGAQCYLAAVERILDREADSVDRDIANMILKAEVQP